jgi:hypothetical protein
MCQVETTHDSSITAEQTAQELLKQDFRRASFARLDSMLTSIGLRFEELSTGKKKTARGGEEARAAGG